MKKLFLFIITVCFFAAVPLAAGEKSILLSSGSNGFTVRAVFESVPAEIKKVDGVQVMNFTNASDESKPGMPSLPGRTLFIALPPNVTASFTLVNVKKHVYQNTEPSVNPKIFLGADSTVSYRPMKLSSSSVAEDRYPAGDIETAGYLWIGNYYCAAVKVNTYSYQFSTNQITELQGADIRVQYGDQPPAAVKNSVPESEYEKNLKDVILNYQQAKDFRSVRPKTAAADSLDNWIDYTKQYVKLAFAADGIYRITYADLQGYGIDPGAINPMTFRLFESGKELPVYVSGEGDAVFDTTDYIEFYGRKHYGSKNYRSIVSKGSDYLNYMDRYSDTTIVWLTWGGANGLRIGSTEGSGASSDTVQSQSARIHLEKDSRLWYYDVEDPRSQLPFWQEHKIWSWLFFNSGTVSNISFTANSILPGSLCTATFRLIANGTDAGQSSSKIGIGFNSTTIAEGDTFAYRQTVNFQSTYSSSRLKEGSNSIKVQGLAGGTFQFLVDWVDIDYYRYTKAVSDTIFITIPDSVSKAFRKVKVTGLTTSNVLIYKVTPSMSRIVNFSVSGGTQKTCLFSDTVSGGDQYYVLSAAKVRKPLFVVKKQFEDLRRADRGADYIVISNKVLKNSVSAYANFIQSSYGLRTQVAYVDDIYDEFYFGYNHPESIREFLLQANTKWQAPAASYLLLIGEANYDYKNVTTGLLQKKPNLVPSYGDPVSDTWYVTWNPGQPDIPQMYVGRIPAETDADVNFYLQKHQAYLLKPFDEWNKTFLFFSGGDPNTSGQIDQIRNANNAIFTDFALSPPVGGLGYHFYKTTNPVSNFGPVSPELVQSALQNGSLFISYIGHSGTQTWDNGITAVSDLKNSYSNRFPLVSDFGCSTGKFAEPDIDCFAELFVSQNHDGQAISYLGNTSLGYLSTSLRFPSYFYRKILKDTVTIVGEAHLLAKIQQLQQTGFGDANRVFTYCNTLFGDPIINLALPKKPNIHLDDQSVSLIGSVPIETDDSVSLKIVTKNLGRMPADSVRLSVTDKLEGSVVFSRSYAIDPNIFWDTTFITIPVKGRVGKHVISVLADSAQLIGEMDDADNAASLNFVVYSTTVRSLEQNSFYNAARKSILVLNPTYRLGGTAERIRISIDTTDTFLTPVELTKDFDPVSTEIPLTGLVTGKRYWWKAKIDQPELEWSTPSSFVNVNSAAQWYAESPRSDGDFLYENTFYNTPTKQWELTSGIKNLKVTSAGTSAGSFVSVAYNGNEKSPNTYFWGIVTAKIDTITLQPYEFRYFLYPASQSADSLTNYINALPAGTRLAMSICDDGAQSVLGFSPPTAVRNAIKLLGSSFVDSVKYRESWCIIGTKGAAAGSVPESYKRQFEGPATVQISVNTPPDSGKIIFPSAGIASAWDSVMITSTVPAGARIDIIPLGMKNAIEADTLPALTVNGSGAMVLNSINAQTYPKVKLSTAFHTNTNKESPAVSSIAIFYKEYPELAVNYQVVGTYKAERVNGTDSVAISQTKADSVVQGKYLGLRWKVYNAGKSAAKNVHVQTTVIWDNNYREELGTVTIDSILPGTFTEAAMLYNSSAGTGNRRLQISVDPSDSIQEFYKDNNVYTTSFVVTPDPVPIVLPNLIVESGSITIPTNIPDNIDSVAVHIAVRNSGSARYDSVDVLIQQKYLSAQVKSWNVRIPIPVLSDTITLFVPVKGMAGEHQIVVTVDPFSKVIESSKDDNTASKIFFVATTEFSILQPDQFNVSFVPSLILLTPLAEAWDGNKKILLDIDTADSFTGAARFTPVMGQISTSVNISSLKRSTRYWWRAKVENGMHDWTVGTFFMGDSLERAVGQVDSAAWAKNVFSHTSYSGGGARIEDTSTKFRLVSAGVADGGYGVIELNGSNLIVNAIDTCHFLAVLDSNYRLITYRRFNLFSDPSQSDSLAAFLAAVPAGEYVAAVIVGEGSKNFSASARNAYKLIGGSDVNLIGWRDSWSIIGRKGSSIGSVPEQYRPSGTGKAEIDTTYYKREERGTIVTEEFGPVVSWQNLTIQRTLPAGTSLNVGVLGITRTGTTDTLSTSLNPQTIDLRTVSGNQYPYGRLFFTLNRNGTAETPVVQEWKLTAKPSSELAISQRGITVEKNVMNEGELSNLAMKIFNAGGVDLDSVTAEITSDDNGFPRSLLTTIIPVLRSNDSVTVQTQYDSRNKRGTHSFTFTVDPDNVFPEIDKTNNSLTVPYTVIADTIRPLVQVTVDGSHVLNGDYVSPHPEIVIQYRDNNPSGLLPSDTSIFSLKLNNERAAFTPGSAELQISGTAGEARIRWTPMMPEGENIIQISANDISGNASDTTTLYVNVSSKLQLLDVYNIPNPFAGSTRFTFKLTGSSNADELSIKIYTVAGRLIHEIQGYGKVGFNSIYWDGRDSDGDEIGNGVYLYRLMVKQNDTQIGATSKLVKMK